MQKETLKATNDIVDVPLIEENKNKQENVVAKTKN